MSVCLCVCLCVCLSECLSVFMSLRLCTCLSECLCLCLSECLSVCVSVCLSVCCLYVLYCTALHCIALHCTVLYCCDCFDIVLSIPPSSNISMCTSPLYILVSFPNLVLIHNFTFFNIIFVTSRTLDITPLHQTFFSQYIYCLYLQLYLIHPIIFANTSIYILVPLSIFLFVYLLFHFFIYSLIYSLFTLISSLVHLHIFFSDS